MSHHDSDFLDSRPRPRWTGGTALFVYGSQVHMAEGGRGGQDIVWDSGMLPPAATAAGQ